MIKDTAIYRFLRNRLIDAMMSIVGYNPKRSWEKLGKTYIRHSGRKEYFYPHDFLLHELKGIKPASIIEIGCGFGRNLKFIDDKLKIRRLSGIDFSRSMLQNARKYLNKIIELKYGSALKIPYKDKRFDVAFTFTTLEYIKPDEIYDALKELVRVAKQAVIIIEKAMKNYKLRYEKIYTFDTGYGFYYNWEKMLKKLGYKYSVKRVQSYQLCFINLKKRL